MTNWYNTINFSGDDLKKENAKAKGQEDLILAIFKANPLLELSPDQIHKILARKYNLYPPITSIRRAITNLTGRMELIKTDTMIPGEYHLPTHTWKLAVPTEQPKPVYTVNGAVIQTQLFTFTEGE